MRLGERVKKARMALGLSQRQLGKQLEMNHSHLALIESHQRFPLGFGPVIADFLGISDAELLRMVMEEKLAEQVNGPYLSMEKIELVAEKDRNSVLSRLGRSAFSFPKDRNVIPDLLCGLQVIEDDILFSAEGKEAYAGLFVEGYKFQTVENAIAVATKQVNEGRRENASAQTLTFQILHEVGHYRLHWSNNKFRRMRAQRAADRPLYCSTGDNSQLEIQANNYAAAFLMPKSEIINLVETKTTTRVQNHIQEWCDHFYVEPWTLKQRLRALRIKVR